MAKQQQMIKDIWHHPGASSGWRWLSCCCGTVVPGPVEETAAAGGSRWDPRSAMVGQAPLGWDRSRPHAASRIKSPRPPAPAGFPCCCFSTTTASTGTGHASPPPQPPARIPCACIMIVTALPVAGGCCGCGASAHGPGGGYHWLHLFRGPCRDSLPSIARGRPTHVYLVRNRYTVCSGHALSESEDLVFPTVWLIQVRVESLSGRHRWFSICIL